MVDQAIVLLKRYDDSTLAMRGMRLLSSLLEGTTKQQLSEHHARHNKENKAHPHEGNPSAWPLEDHRSIDAMWASKQSDSMDDSLQPSASTTISLQQGSQPRTTPATSISEDADVLNAPVQNTDDYAFTNADGSLGGLTDNDILSDTAWRPDLFSDYFPAQSAFENPFLIENLLAQAHGVSR